jgi:hypothetical protein
VIYDCSAFSDHEIKRSKIMLFHVPSSSRKVVPYLGCVSSCWEIIFKIIFCIYLLLEKLINEKYFSVKEKFGLVLEKYFSFILDGKHFLKVVKNLEMLYYLLIISNLVLKLLITIYIYIIFNICFLISSLII